MIDHDGIHKEGGNLSNSNSNMKNILTKSAARNQTPQNPGVGDNVNFNNNNENLVVVGDVKKQRVEEESDSSMEKDLA